MIDKVKLLARLEELRAEVEPYSADKIADLMDEVEGWTAPHRTLESPTMPDTTETFEEYANRAIADRTEELLVLHKRIDTLMAAVEALKVGERVGTEYERGLHDAADYVLGILAEEPHDA